MKVGIVGAGLLGTSLGLALADYELWISDSDPLRRDLAADLLQASTDPSQCDLVVVATPPSTISEVVVEQIRLGIATTVTDLGSIKTKPLVEVSRELGRAVDSYLPGHPIAGRELSGPTAARGDLFAGRPWIVTPHDQLGPGHLDRLKEVIASTGALAVELSPQEHDRAMAALSHGPQLIASLAATAVANYGNHLELAGQGVKDLTRIAASDPELWAQILTANAEAVSGFWNEFQRLVDQVSETIKSKDEKSIYQVIDQGRKSRSLLPGKHGVLSTNFASISVVIEDRAGQLGALFSACAEFGANVEDLSIEHTPGRATGIVELAVEPAAVDGFVDFLRGKGWRAHSLSRQSG